MRPRFQPDQPVRATRVLRNDGTYPEPGLGKGAVLVPRGARGTVVDIGTFLQDRLVYAVWFENGRLVGCLEHELEPLADAGAGEDLETGAVLGSAPAGAGEEARRPGRAAFPGDPAGGGEGHVPCRDDRNAPPGHGGGGDPAGAAGGRG